jgi:hypothetical protein
VTTNTAQTITGVKTFSANIIANSVTITPTVLGYIGGLTSNAQTQINSKTTLADVQANNNIWTGTNEFNTSLPTSTLTPSLGTQFVTKAYADANYASTGCTSKIESYEVMTAYNIGFLRNPEAGVNHYFCHANTRVGTRALKWKIIGDDKGFWIATEYSTTVGLWTVAYFGDYVPVHLSNKTNWINFTQLTLMEVGTNHLKCHNTTLNNEIRVSRDYLNNLPSQKVYFMSGCGVNTTNSNIQIGKSPLVSPINIYTVPLIATTVLYGWLPGLYEPVCTTTTSSVTVYSATKSIINLQLNENTGRVGLLVGEGFRP